jgi:Spy/CpxP family protein refolding chaperone
VKHIRSALIASLVAIGGAAALSAQQTTPAPTATKHGRHGKAGERLDEQLFRGITLSDAEKANIANVRNKYAPQMKALRQQAKPQTQALRAARHRGDTAAVRQLMAQTAPQRDQERKLLQAEQNDFRGALVPANQAKFDANLKQVQRRMAKHGKGGINAGAGE